MKNESKRFGWTDITLLVLSLVFFVGTLTFLKACGPKEDGSWMTCHWACQALRGVAGAMLLLAVLRLFSASRVKIGLSLASAVLAVLAICIPGHLIGLCMMKTMRCHSVMVPGVMVLSILTILAAAADILLRHRKGNAT